MGNVFGDLTAGLGGLFGQGQAQQLGQQRGMLGYTSTSDSTAGANPWRTATIEFGVPPTAPQIEAGPETALAWLDRRVEEMRVKL